MSRQSGFLFPNDSGYSRKGGIVSYINNCGLFVTLILTQGGCIMPPTIDDENTIRIGALLPFTGRIATHGANIERAILFAVEQVNETGGIAGRQVQLVASDTHSDLKTGLQNSKALVNDEHVTAILGPQNENLAKRMVPFIRENQVVQISGGVTSPSFSTMQDGGFWFRTYPSALLLSQALAQQMYIDGVRKAAILYIGDEYGNGFAAMLTNQLLQHDIEVPPPWSFMPKSHTYTAVLQRIKASEPDAIALIAYPRSGATIVQEWMILGNAVQWYFAPTLKNQMFIANVPPGMLEGSIGVSVSLGDDAKQFAHSFAERWHSEEPFDAAYFYYDATALLLLAMVTSTVETGGQVVLSGNQLRQAVTDVSGPLGQRVAWDEFSRGIELAINGEPIDYYGVSGPVDLDEYGDVIHSNMEFWKIENDRIVSAF
ncbi:MAG: ABC transporter substrate-binding protein [Gammaproteobacteria bacterium]|nr:ABC transporter substrate-binding protein [Gammaproteobacteria bacterium]